MQENDQTFPRTLTCAYSECQRPFVVQKKGRGKPKIFCSKDCRVAHNSRLYKVIVELGKQAARGSAAGIGQAGASECSTLV